MSMGMDMEMDMDKNMIVDKSWLDKQIDMVMMYLLD